MGTSQRNHQHQCQRIFIERRSCCAFDETKCNVLWAAATELNHHRWTDHYRRQLFNLNRTFKEKWPQYAKRHDKVILLHDNARPHAAEPMKEILESLEWNVLPYALFFTLLLQITTCFGCSMVFLSSTSVISKISKNDSITGSSLEKKPEFF